MRKLQLLLIIGFGELSDILGSANNNKGAITRYEIQVHGIFEISNLFIWQNPVAESKGCSFILIIASNSVLF